jgi:predicted RNA-binding Zn-ribbon protein involved in translation (DUF1610 family)
MAVLGDVVEILRRWDVWKRVEDGPKRIDELEGRVAELERRLQRAPGEACPRCGALSYRVDRSEEHRTLGHMGTRVHHMKCEDCGFTDEKLILPKK